MSTGTDAPWEELRAALSGAREHSRTVATYRRARRILAAYWLPVAVGLSRAADYSALRGIGRRAVAAIRHSFTYRWLTAEPDPEVVVIDLRETWTVGPVLGLVERLAASGPVQRADAILAALGRPIRRAPVRLASLALLIFAATALALTWSVAGPAGRLTWLGVLGIALLGLRVDASWQDVADSRVGRALGRAFEPPERGDDRDAREERP